jgi:hypothetical protein
MKLAPMSLYAWTLAPLILLHIWMFFRHRSCFRFQLLLDVVLLVVMAPAWVRNADLNPVKCIQGSPPFKHVQWSPQTQFQPTQSDLAYYFHPWWELAGRQIARGKMPELAAEVGAGLPLLANGQIGLWAPMMVPVWLHGPERGTTIMAFWKLEIAGLGAFLFLYGALRLRWLAAAVGGIGWAGTPYLVGWLLVPLAWAVASLPWLWLGLWRVMGRRARWWSIGGLGVVFGWLMGAGLHPETTAIVCGSALLVALLLHPRRFNRVIVIAGIAAVVAAALAWPTLRYIPSSSRVSIVGEGESNLSGLPWSMQRDLARQIVVPASMGHPGRRDWRPEYPYSAGAAGVGGALLALLAAGRIRRRYRVVALAAGGCAALGLVLLVRIPPLDALLVRIPPLSQMTIPRFAVLIPWGLVVLAALAFDGALRGRRRSIGFRIVPAVVVAVVALLAAPFGLAPVDSALVAASVAAAVAVAFLGRFGLVPALVMAELAVLAIGINPVASTADRLPRPPLLERLAELEAVRACRVIGVGRFLIPNLASRYGLRDFRAADPLRPEPFARLMGVLGEPPAVLGGPIQRAPAGLCGAWGVGLAVVPPGRQLPGWQREYSDADGSIWSNALLLPEVRVVGEAITEPEDRARLSDLLDQLDFKRTALVDAGAAPIAAVSTTLEIGLRDSTRVETVTECDGPCLVVVAQPWAPGWQAWVDGRRVPVVRTNVAGLGLVAPEGRHSVELAYHPWNW